MIDQIKIIKYLSFYQFKCDTYLLNFKAIIFIKFLNR